MFFNPAFGKEWFGRMKKLGFKDPDTMRAAYQRLTENDLGQIGAQIGGSKRFIFAVKHSDVKMLKLPVVYRNEEFIIYQVAPKQTI